VPKAKSVDKNQCRRCQERAAAPDPRVPLRNPRHEKFSRNIALLNMTNQKAYSEAGFDAKNVSNKSNAASTLRKKIDVQNRIIVLAEKAIEGDLRTREWVDNQLKEIVDRCMKKVPVIEPGKKGKTCDACYNHLGDWKFDPRNANTALHLMGKDRGMFVEKIQIIDDDLVGKSPEEVIEIAKALAVDLGRDFVKLLCDAVGIPVADTLPPAPTVEATKTLN
jgi:hypothetical protein